MLAIIDITVRFALLIFATMVGEIALEKRIFGLTVFFLGIYLTFVRMVIYRSTEISIGLFKYENTDFLIKLKELMLSVYASIIPDTLLLIGVIWFLGYVRKIEHKKRG